MSTVRIGTHDVPALDVLTFLCTEARWRNLLTADIPRLTAAAPTDEEPLVRLICPHCHADSEPSALDLSLRVTDDPDITLDLRAISYSYEGGDYHGIGYLCGQCQRPVGLPEGWAEI